MSLTRDKLSRHTILCFHTYFQRGGNYTKTLFIIISSSNNSSIVCVYVHKHTHILWCTWGQKINFRSQLAIFYHLGFWVSNTVARLINEALSPSDPFCWPLSLFSSEDVFEPLMTQFFLTNLFHSITILICTSDAKVPDTSASDISLLPTKECSSGKSDSFP